MKTMLPLVCLPLLTTFALAQAADWRNFSLKLDDEGHQTTITLKAPVGYQPFLDELSDMKRSIFIGLSFTDRPALEEFDGTQRVVSEKTTEQLRWRTLDFKGNPNCSPRYNTNVLVKLGDRPDHYFQCSAMHPEEAQQAEIIAVCLSVKVGK